MAQIGEADQLALFEALHSGLGQHRILFGSPGFELSGKPLLAAVAHGKLRYAQGYTPEMLVHESRIFQVTIFGTLQSNLNALDFSLLLPDVMTIADEVYAQLTQSMGS